MSLKSEKEYWNYNQAKNENIKRAGQGTSTLTPSNTKRASEMFTSTLRLISSKKKEWKRSSPCEKPLINASRGETHFNSHFNRTHHLSEHPIVYAFMTWSILIIRFVYPVNAQNI